MKLVRTSMHLPQTSSTRAPTSNRGFGYSITVVTLTDGPQIESTDHPNARGAGKRWLQLCAWAASLPRAGKNTMSARTPDN